MTPNLTGYEGGRCLRFVI